jgi:hypothetical protein
MRFLTHMAHNVPAPRCTGTEQDEGAKGAKTNTITSSRLTFSGEGTAWGTDFTRGVKIIGRSQSSVLKPHEKTELVGQLQSSGAGRGRRGTAAKGEPPSNITLDTRELPAGRRRTLICFVPRLSQTGR